jgi:methyl-accepting chemotaxis protein
LTIINDIVITKVSIEVDLYRKDKEALVCELSATVIYDEYKDVLGILALLHDEMDIGHILLGRWLNEYVSFIISYSISAPLSKLKNIMDEAQSGKFDVSLLDNNNDEISKIATGFNDMISSIRELIKENMYLMH